MASRGSELDPRGLELFERKLFSGVEDDGLMDRVGIPKERFIERSGALLDKLMRHTPPRDGFLARDLLRWHGHVFAPTGLPEAGSFRSAGDPLNPNVGVGVDIVDESNGCLAKVRIPIPGPETVRERLDTVLDEFNERIPDLKSQPESLHAMAKAAVRVHIDTYLIHPFADGNSRTTGILLQMALYRLCKTRLRYIPGEPAWHLARSYALRPDERRTIDPLVDLVTQRLEDARQLEEERRR